MNTKSLLLLVLAFVMGTGISLYAQNSQQPDHFRQQVQTFEGYVTAIDWVASTISVSSHYLAPAEEKSFIVPTALEITKGGDTISFEDLGISYHVVIRYTVDPDGNNRIVSMTIIGN